MMQTFLDFFIGNMMLSVLLLSFFFVGTIFSKRLWATWRKDFAFIFVFVGSFALLIGVAISVMIYYNPYHWGYGRAHNFRFVTTSSDKILLHDELVEVTSESLFAPHKRLCVLDAKTGKRLYRGMLGYLVEPVHRQGDTLWYASKYMLTVFDVRQLKILFTTNQTELKKITELSKGVKFEEVEWHEAGKEILLVTLDGYKYWFNPFTRTVRLKTSTPLPPQPHKASQKGYKPRYTLKAFSKTDLREMIVDSTEKQLSNASLTFLRGEIMHINYELKRLIIKHFEATDAKKNEFILVAVDFDGNAIWEKRRKDFACFDFFSLWNKYDFHQSLIIDDKIVLTFGGFVYALDLQNGKRIWENRL